MAAFANSGPLLHQAERRPALFIERDNLAIQNRRPRFNGIWNRAKLRIRGGQVVLVTRHQAHRTAFQEGDCAIAIPLHLVKPIVAVERLIDEGRQHGMDSVGHRRFMANARRVGSLGLYCHARFFFYSTSGGGALAL